MIFALDREHRDYPHRYERTGQPFITLARGRWNVEASVGQIRAADAYLDRHWYRVCISKSRNEYSIRVAGKFQFAGDTTYEGTIERKRVFHGDEDVDYFMAGDPHINFYEGSVYYDDVELYVPAF